MPDIKDSTRLDGEDTSPSKETGTVLIKCNDCREYVHTEPIEYIPEILKTHYRRDDTTLIGLHIDGT